MAISDFLPGRRKLLDQFNKVTLNADTGEELGLDKKPLPRGLYGATIESIGPVRPSMAYKDISYLPVVLKLITNLYGSNRLLHTIIPGPKPLLDIIYAKREAYFNMNVTADVKVRIGPDAKTYHNSASIIWPEEKQHGSKA